MFSEKTINFLVENRIMNSRKWFADHHDDYSKYVVEPLAQLVCELAPTAIAIDELVVTEPKTGKTISRINRDTRFTKDKLFYREEMWISFRRPKHQYPQYPEIYFSLGPNGFSYGCGYYIMKKEALENFRRLIRLRDPLFVSALEAYEVQNKFILGGDAYKRTKHPDEPENIRTWLDRKGVFFSHDSKDASLLFSDRLAPTVAEDLKLLKPIYDFFILCEQPMMSDGDE
ncbi:MAG: DUF2461 domain-containing protein [Oscillospiraceae bacterium]|nr:DUF2461 domain-containing protein [Oscillospiraceae bacterium]MBQ3048784.1 DUF2461 domain-containing protein [Oscillospiraceae bacterium]